MQQNEERKKERLFCAFYCLAKYSITLSAVKESVQRATLRCLRDLFVHCVCLSLSSFFVLDVQWPKRRFLSTVNRDTWFKLMIAGVITLAALPSRIGVVLRQSEFIPSHPPKLILPSNLQNSTIRLRGSNVSLIYPDVQIWRSCKSKEYKEDRWCKTGRVLEHL